MRHPRGSNCDVSDLRERANENLLCSFNCFRFEKKKNTRRLYVSFAQCFLLLFCLSVFFFSIKHEKVNKLYWAKKISLFFVYFFSLLIECESPRVALKVGSRKVSLLIYSDEFIEQEFTNVVLQECLSLSLRLSMIFFSPLAGPKSHENVSFHNSLSHTLYK